MQSTTTSPRSPSQLGEMLERGPIWDPSVWPISFLFCSYGLRRMCRYMGHFCGALAGLLAGIAVLDNRVVETWETWVSYINSILVRLDFPTHWRVGEPDKTYTTHTKLVQTNEICVRKHEQRVSGQNRRLAANGGESNLKISSPQAPYVCERRNWHDRMDRILDFLLPFRCGGVASASSSLSFFSQPVGTSLDPSQASSQVAQSLSSFSWMYRLIFHKYVINVIIPFPQPNIIILSNHSQHCHQPKSYFALLMILSWWLDISEPERAVCQYTSALNSDQSHLWRLISSFNIKVQILVSILFRHRRKRISRSCSYLIPSRQWFWSQNQ